MPLTTPSTVLCMRTVQLRMRKLNIGKGRQITNLHLLWLSQGTVVGPTTTQPFFFTTTPAIFTTTHRE